MKIWFDTEFYENGRTIDLISIGAVREDGATFYAESVDAFDLACSSPWLTENVRPHLRGNGWGLPRRTIHDRLINFAGDKPEFWAYYADYDWVVLCQLFGTMMDLPAHFPKFCMDVKQLAVLQGNPTLPKQEAGEHDAMADAIWCRQAWEFLQSVKAVA